eukprot:1669397-Amphidinium_carterae.1
MLLRMCTDPTPQLQPLCLRMRGILREAGSAHARCAHATFHALAKGSVIPAIQHLHSSLVNPP